MGTTGVICKPVWIEGRVIPSQVSATLQQSNFHPVPTCPFPRLRQGIAKTILCF